MVDITAARAARIHELVSSGAAGEEFGRFLKSLRSSLNENYTQEEAVSVLAQYEVTRPIFESLFDNPTVIDNNPIVRGVERALDGLYEYLTCWGPGLLRLGAVVG